LFDAVLTRARRIQPIGQDLEPENQSLDIGPMHAMDVVAMQTTRQLCDFRQSTRLEHIVRDLPSSATHKGHIDEPLLSGSERDARIGWQEEQ
jgi:hypothetical protein